MSVLGPEVTRGRSADWDAVAVEPWSRTQLNRCPNCGGLTLLASGPHSARWVTTEGGRLVVVDCTGRVVREASR